MDLREPRTEHTAAVPLDGDFAVGVVLRSGTGDGREFETDAVHRRAIHTDAVLWDSKDDLVARRARLRGQSEAGTPADAADGTGGDLPEATAVGSRARTSHLSVSAARAENRSAEPSLVQRHNLHSATARVPVSGCGHGLVQPVCTGLGSIGFLGHVLLPGGSRLGLTIRTARYFQQGSRIAVHQRRFHQAAGDSRHRHQHGRAWASERQHFHRTFMADGEIRRGLSEGLHRCAGGSFQPEKLFWFLQSRTSASSLGLSDAGGDLLRKAEGRPRRQNRGDATGRANELASFLGHPGAEFFCGKLGRGTKKEKRSKKERSGGLVETDAADGNPLRTRIPTAAWKAQNAFHSSHKARRRRFHHRIHFFERLRSTLNTLSFGPKDGGHLSFRHGSE